MQKVDWAKVRKKAAALAMAWWDRRDTSKDIRYLAFAAYVVAAMTWLSLDLRSHGITGPWVDAFKWFAASVSLGGAAWMLAESRGGQRGEETRPSKDEGAEDPQQGGES